MNWKQVHTSSTPEERIETITLMLQHIEARKKHQVLAGGRLIRERRRAKQPYAHFISDRRRRMSPRTYMTLFTIAISAVTVSTFAISKHIPLGPGAIIMLLYELALLLLMLGKPYLRWRPMYAQDIY